MHRKWVRAALAILLVAVLAVPVGDLPAFAQQAPPADKQEKPPQPDKQQKPPQQPEYAIAVEVPVVNVDVLATTSNGDFITGLRKENFRVLEDGVPQTITNFSPAEAPITMVIVLEFSSLFYGIFAYYGRNAAYDFLRQLKPNDWVALKTYDLKSRIEVDFTRNKQEVREALARMYFPGFSEANLFDAVIDTLDQLRDVKGKKSILLLASGLDTFSRHTLDDVLKRLRQSDVTIFSIGLGRSWVERFRLDDVTYQQAVNQLSSFARMTGGQSWFPRFEGEFPGIFRDVAASLRNQYSLAYTPINRTRDGKFRKIKVEVVNPDGSPLTLTNEKGKKLKAVVYAREGYLAPKGAVGN